MDSTMRYVSGDTLAHVMVVNVRDIAKIGGRAIKRTGGSLPVFPRDRENLVLCRTLHERFFKGDYRMTRTEHKRFIEAVDWLQRHDQLNKLQLPRPYVEVLEEYVWSDNKLPRKTYQGLIARLCDGSMDAVASQ